MHKSSESSRGSIATRHRCLDKKPSTMCARVLSSNLPARTSAPVNHKFLSLHPSITMLTTWMTFVIRHEARCPELRFDAPGSWRLSRDNHIHQLLSYIPGCEHVDRCVRLAGFRPAQFSVPSAHSAASPCLSFLMQHFSDHVSQPRFMPFDGVL